MKTHAYLFEAKSIQAYILDSGKLRDLVGASELVDRLCGEPLDDTLAALGIDGRVAFSRRAGGAFYAFSDDAGAIAGLAALWPLVAQQFGPGLDFDQAVGEGADALDALERAQQAVLKDRARARVRLPQAGPRVHLSQRTGRPAEAMRRTPDRDLELVDGTTLRQRRFNRLDGSGLLEKLTPEGSGLDSRHWPLDLEAADAVGDAEEPAAAPFPFLGDDRYIAVVHADGNGLGQLLMRLKGRIEAHARERFVAVFRDFSEGIEQATRRAARAGVDQVLLPARETNRDSELMPARPIVLGGDDLTMILRADLALPFTREFLVAFEHETAPLMDRLRREHGLADLPRDLTACAGIAYIKASQPFHLAARLAEGITAAVKRQAKAVDKDRAPSSLAFHRVTTAMIDDYGEVVRRELSVNDADTRYCNSLGAYAVSPCGELPALDDLLELQRLMQREDMARGPSRQILTLLAQSPSQTEVRFSRWHTLLQDRDRQLPEDRRRLPVFTALMDRLVPGWQDCPLPYRKLAAEPGEPLGGADYAGPFGDLHALLAVKNRLSPLRKGEAGDDR